MRVSLILMTASISMMFMTSELFTENYLNVRTSQKDTYRRFSMIYGYIGDQWNTLKITALALQENLSEAIETQSYSNEQEEQELRHMRRACNNVIAALLGYVD
ncbi:MAG: hypothetical protein IJQ77_08105 [Synergistaceae bacterium]|nr:hypothetical protein [Synergistaceae bacterium]MBR0251032.1 hypothetical protein [Synergistaceae bacterium]